MTKQERIKQNIELNKALPMARLTKYEQCVILLAHQRTVQDAFSIADEIFKRIETLRSENGNG